jgi:hypothetical protein
MPVPEDLQDSLHEMLAELESAKLEVVLAPCRKPPPNVGAMIRVASSVPPLWYRKLCGEHLSKRGARRGKPDTRIKRANVLSLLRVLCRGVMSKSKYAPEILREAKSRASCPF